MKQPALARMSVPAYVTRLLFLIILAGSQLALAQEDEKFPDVIYLKNGDRITGSIKELDRGKMRLKTETMDTVYLDWDDIESIDSVTYLRIVATDGAISYGRMEKSDVEATVTVAHGEELTDTPLYQIASMKPLRIDERFLQQLEGEVSAGLDYGQVADLLLVNLDSSLRYREEKYEIELGLNWAQTRRDEGNNYSRSSLIVDYTRLLEDRYFWATSLGFESNEGLGIDLRSIVAGAAGRFLVQTPIMQLHLSAGLAGSAEDRTNGTSQESIEGLIRSSFDLFKLSTPMTRLSASVSVFPGITEKDRLRVNSKLSLRNEFIRDFFWDLSIYSNYDNQSVQGADNSDYGIITSLGASF